MLGRRERKESFAFKYFFVMASHSVLAFITIHRICTEYECLGAVRSLRRTGANAGILPPHKRSIYSRWGGSVTYRPPVAGICPYVSNPWFGVV